ncbi:LysR family transcriptional regulator [Sporolactobacillus sp. KGMB 08714]|uniref:LysR family transcriptional regulator n=1 Tax=Sporolactobacillus sp. KGMB 08714 TaxID=3064704 RepID=UPI002FBEC50D
MDFYQMKCVLTVAKHHSVSKAAEELCVTPPSLSQQIKKAEDELGVKLFVRSTHDIWPSEAGNEFIKRAQKIFAELSKMNDIMNNYASGTIGHLVIGCVPVMKESGLLHFIKLFTERYPHISLEFYEAECFDLYPLLYSGKIDVLISTAADPEKPKKIKLKSYPLAEDELVLVTSKKHRFANRGIIKLKETAKEPFISFSPSSSLFRVTVDACRRSGFMPVSSCRTHNFDTALGLVAANGGVAIVPLKKVTHTKWKNISIHRLSPKISRTLYLVFLRSGIAKINPIVENFEQFMAQCHLNLHFDEYN